MKNILSATLLFAALICARPGTAQSGEAALNTPAPSKKGLQIQMVDDAIALGVKHAAINVDLAGIFSWKDDAHYTECPPGFKCADSPEPARPNSIVMRQDGREFLINAGMIRGLDKQVKQLTEAGITVTFILLNYVRENNPRWHTIFRHPRADNCPNKISAFNMITDDGRRHVKAAFTFLAQRYNGKAFGRAKWYIVGNEVNTHWQWYNMGHVPFETFAEEYWLAMRLCASVLKEHSPDAVAMISLDHHWYKMAKPTESFKGRDLIDLFVKRAEKEGNFEWGLAHHPYPSNLFECRFWNDKDALPSPDSPKITFKNLEVLDAYFKRPELCYNGKPRPIILSEQGFHSKPGAEGELLQAAAYAYAYKKVEKLTGIDAFIYHRQVDHRVEGGLNLGLWTNDPKAAFPAQPLAKKKIYEVFRAADTPQWEEAFEFALPIVGLKSWDDVK